MVHVVGSSNLPYMAEWVTVEKNDNHNDNDNEFFI